MISVVMSAYNSEKYISEAIESILNQTFSNFEFIIINDYSTDCTLEIIQRYAKQDNRIKIIENKQNRGLTSSLNKGIKEAKGKYIARMDSDDISHPNRLELQYDFLKKNPDVIVLGTAAFNIDENGKIISKRNVPLTNEDIKKTIKLVNPMIHSSVMFRKNEINKIGNYNTDFRIVQDYELWFRCLANDYKMANLDERLIYYRVNDQYFERKSLNYRLTDLKVRWKGYNDIKLPLYKRYGILIPIFLGLAPNRLLSYSYKFLKKYDPRT